jgi:outer membrane lipoprotein-sorting protein
VAPALRYSLRALFVLLAVFGRPPAISAASGGAPTIGEIVERFDRAQARAETLKAHFTLTIKRSMLQAPSVASGVLYLCGSECAHFAFAPPEGLIVHVTGKAVVSYDPAEKRGEVQKISKKKKVDRKSLGLAQRLPYLSDYFKLDAPQHDQGAILVTLRPRSLSLRKKLALVQVWVDRDTYLPKKIKWVERGGDQWLLELGGVQTNVAVPPSVAGFAMPPGTQARQGFSFFAAHKK